MVRRAERTGGERTTKLKKDWKKIARKDGTRGGKKIEEIITEGEGD